MATMSGQSRTWVRAQRRPRRALFLSSPIGLGHARRDVAIAQELRRLQPDLQIDWLAQHPVTRVLADAGETVHPASAWLANESAHIEDESADHDLHAFQAIRRMDEILVNNFMVFNDVVDETYYDLVIGDEAWDVDYFLHENPELKRFAFAWMTDFVGWLPDAQWRGCRGRSDCRLQRRDARAAGAVPPAARPIDLRRQPGRRRRRIVRTRAARHPRLDDGELRLRRLRHRIRAAADEAARRRVRARLGFGPGRPPVRRHRRRIGRRRCAAAPGDGRDPARSAPAPRAAIPRRDRPAHRPGSLPRRRGATVRGFVPDLYLTLAACDVAVVQGGLTTCMELAAARRPFLYVPLENHFEQNFHVRHRLDSTAPGAASATPRRPTRRRLPTRSSPRSGAT